MAHCTAFPIESLEILAKSLRPTQNRPTIRNVEKNYMEYSFFRLDT